MSLDKFIGNTKKKKQIPESKLSINSSEEVESIKEPEVTTNNQLSEQKLKGEDQTKDREDTSTHFILAEKTNTTLEKENQLTELDLSYTNIVDIAKFHPLYMNYLNDVLWLVKSKSTINPEQYLEIKFNMPKPFIRILMAEAQKISNTAETE